MNEDGLIVFSQSNRPLSSFGSDTAAYEINLLVGENQIKLSCTSICHRVSTYLGDPCCHCSDSWSYVLLFKLSSSSLYRRKHGKIGAQYFCNSLNSLSLRYEPFEPNDVKDYVSHANTVVFLQSSFQYIWESVVFSRGAPYRRSIFSNCTSIPSEPKLVTDFSLFSFKGCLWLLSFWHSVSTPFFSFYPRKHSMTSLK